MILNAKIKPDGDEDLKHYKAIKKVVEEKFPTHEWRILTNVHRIGYGNCIVEVFDRDTDFHRAGIYIRRHQSLEEPLTLVESIEIW